MKLISLSTKESTPIQISVKTIIQDLIDGKLQIEQFCNLIEKLLNASPQPIVVEFLKVILFRNIFFNILKEFILEKYSTVKTLLTDKRAGN